MERLLFSRREAATALSVSLNTIDELVADSTLSVLRLGKRVLIPRESLDRLAASAEKSNGVSLR